MTHYSENPGHVRAEFFRPSGKWYATAVLDMSDLYWSTCGGPDQPEGQRCVAWPHTPGRFLHDAIDVAWRTLDHYLDMTCVVSEPYHENGYPVLLTSLKQRDEARRQAIDTPSRPNTANAINREFLTQHAWNPDIYYAETPAGPMPVRVTMTWDEWVRAITTPTRFT